MSDEIVKCAKCGATEGWDGPRYKGQATPTYYGVQVLCEALVYSCLRCGYEREQPTLDFQERESRWAELEASLKPEQVEQQPMRRWWWPFSA